MNLLVLASIAAGLGLSGIIIGAVNLSLLNKLEERLRDLADRQDREYTRHSNDSVSLRTTHQLESARLNALASHLGLGIRWTEAKPSRAEAFKLTEAKQ